MIGKRWLRIRLKTVLILVGLANVGLGWIALERRQSATERQIAAELQSFGPCEIEFGGPYDSYERNESNISQGWWRNLARLVFGERALRIVNNTGAVSDLTRIAEFEYLQVLIVYGSPVTDVSPLSKLTNMKYLDLAQTNVKDITPLASLTGLQGLCLNDTEVMDITPLSGSRELESLWLMNTMVVDLTPLSEVKSLRLLEIGSDDIRISGEQIRMLKTALPDCAVSEFGFERTLDNTPIGTEKVPGTNGT